MVKTITRDEFDKPLHEALAEAGISMDDFVEAGRNDKLESEELRTLWLIAGPVLIADD